MQQKQLIATAVSKQLPNGLKYICQTDCSNPVLCLQLYVRIGSAWESDSEGGYAHFLEHLAFKSTRCYGYNQIMQVINSLGGSMNAYTDFDCTCFYILLPKEHMFDGLKVLAEISRCPTFTASDVTMEKDIIIEELEQTKNEPESDFLDFIQRLSLRDNPLKKPVLGTVRSIRKASAKKIRAFHDKYYQPKNTFLVIAGDVDPESLGEPVSALFGGWQNTDALPHLDYTAFREPEQVPQPSFFRKNKQEFLAYVLPELCDAHPDSDSMLFAMRYLAVGRSSRLYKRLIEEEKICSAVKVISYCGVMTGVSVIMINPMHQKFTTRINTIFHEEYQAILRGEFDSQEFELVKKDIINTWRYGFEGVENLAHMIGAEEFAAGFEKLYIYDKQIQAITLKDVNSAIVKYWQPAQLIIFHQAQQPISLTEDEHQHFARNTIHTLLVRTLTLMEPDVFHSNQLRIEQIADNLYSSVLPNGLNFIYRFIPNRLITGYALATNVSQLSESPEQRGLNYLSSTAMLHATTNRSNSDLLKLCREHGLSLNVEQHLDSTIFRGKCFHAELAHGLTIMAEICSEPSFEQGNIRLIKAATIDTLRRDIHNPVSYAYYRWFEMLFGAKSSYGRCTGSISEVASHSQEAVRDWFASKYRKDRYTLAIAGSNPPEEVMCLVQKYFATPRLSAKSELETPTPPRPTKLRKKIDQRDSGQTLINLGGFAPQAENKIDTTAFFILAQVLGGDMDSRMFNIIREKHGFAYQTGFDFNSVHDMGHWYAYAYCDPDDYQKCLDLILEILADVCANGITETELLNAQNYLCGMYRFEMEKVSWQSTLLSSLVAVGYDPLYYFQREERIRSVDLATIRKVAADWLQTDNHWTYILL